MNQFRFSDVEVNLEVEVSVVLWAAVILEVVVLLELKKYCAQVGVGRYSFTFSLNSDPSRVRI